jgi:hypothetical protein
MQGPLCVEKFDCLSVSIRDSCVVFFNFVYIDSFSDIGTVIIPSVLFSPKEGKIQCNTVKVLCICYDVNKTLLKQTHRKTHYE